MTEYNISDLANATTVAKATAAKQQADEATGFGLKTSLMADTDPQKALTTYTISDILQGVPFYKPAGATYDTFNQYLSGELENLRADYKEVEFAEDKRLNPFDVFLGTKSSSFGLSGGGSAAPTGGVNGTVAKSTGVASGTFTQGNCPADIPRGPFPLRIVRRPGKGRYDIVRSDVPEVKLSHNQIARLLAAAGCARGDGIAFLICVTVRESNCVANVAGIDFNGGMGVGLWQITDRWPHKRGDGNTYTAEDMTDPWTNVLDCMRISKNGTSMIPWQMSGNYRTADGSHLRDTDIEVGRSIAKEAGLY